MGAAVLKWSASSLPVESVSVAYHTWGLLVLSGVTGRRRPPPSSQKTPADWGTHRSTVLSPFSHSRGASLVAASRGGQQGLRCPLGTGLRQTRGGGGRGRQWFGVTSFRGVATRGHTCSLWRLRNLPSGRLNAVLLLRLFYNFSIGR